MLGLPQTTEVKKIIRKRDLYSKFELNTAEQKEFDAAIRQMTIVNEISLRTIPALQKQEKAVFVLAVQLKQEGCAERLLQRLCRLIDQRLLLALCYEDKLQLALYFDNRILLNEFMPVAEQKVNLQGTSLNDIWEHLALQVAQLTPRAGLTPASVIANAGRRAEAEAQIAALTKKMFAEKQARKKLTLREAINKLKKELEENGVGENPRHHFYPARKVLLGQATPEETDVIEYAMASYAAGRGLFEYPILVVDVARDASGKEGMILTPEHLYYSTAFTSYGIPVASIASVTASTGLLNKGLYVHQKNGTKLKIPYAVGTKELPDYAGELDDFIHYLQEKPESRKLTYLASEKHDTICCFRCGYQYKGGGVCPKCGYQNNG